MKLNSRMIRPIGTSIVAVFLVAGAAFATSTFVGGSRHTDAVPAALDVPASDDTNAESAEPGETAEVEADAPSAGTEGESAEPSETPEASDDHGGSIDGQVAGPTGGHDDDATETPEASDDHGGSDDGAQAGSSPDDHGGSGGDDGSDDDHGGHGSDD
jgi:hypothetical protein